MNNQTNIENVGISDHAVTQFQSRIAQLDTTVARRIIREGIRSSDNVHRLPDGNTMRVRTCRPFPFEFRAYCVFDHTRGHHVVATILRGNSSVTRKRQRKAIPPKERQDLVCGEDGTPAQMPRWGPH